MLVVRMLRRHTRRSTETLLHGRTRSRRHPVFLPGVLADPCSAIDHTRHPRWRGARAVRRQLAGLARRGAHRYAARRAEDARRVASRTAAARRGRRVPDLSVAAERALPRAALRGWRT